MSWSVQAVGRVEAVKRAVEQEFARYGEPSSTNISRAEFEAAKPHLLGLLDQIVGEKNAVKLSASGHGTWSGATASTPDTKTNGVISIETIYLVVDRGLLGFVE